MPSATRAAVHGPAGAGLGGWFRPRGWTGLMKCSPVLAPVFFCREPQLRAQWYVLGLVGLEQERLNPGRVRRGHAGADGMQRLPNARSAMRTGCGTRWAGIGAGRVIRRQAVNGRQLAPPA